MGEINVRNGVREVERRKGTCRSCTAASRRAFSSFSFLTSVSSSLSLDVAFCSYRPLPSLLSLPLLGDLPPSSSSSAPPILGDLASFSLPLDPDLTEADNAADVASVEPLGTLNDASQASDADGMRLDGAGESRRED